MLLPRCKTQHLRAHHSCADVGSGGCVLFIASRWPASACLRQIAHVHGMRSIVAYTGVAICVLLGTK